MNRPKKLDLKNLISWGGSKNPAFFYFTGNFVEFSCKLKSPPGRILSCASTPGSRPELERKMERQLTLREKKKISPHPACESLKYQI